MTDIEKIEQFYKPNHKNFSVNVNTHSDFKNRTRETVMTIKFDDGIKAGVLSLFRIGVNLTTKIVSKDVEIQTSTISTAPMTTLLSNEELKMFDKLGYSLSEQHDQSITDWFDEEQMGYE